MLFHSLPSLLHALYNTLSHMYMELLIIIPVSPLALIPARVVYNGTNVKDTEGLAPSFGLVTIINLYLLIPI